MKRLVAILCVVAMVGFYVKCFAAPTSNASSEIVELSGTWGTGSVTFPTPTRNLIIRNNDAANGVWVDLRSATNTSCRTYLTTDKGECFYMAPATSIELYDFITSGLSFQLDNTFGGDAEASPPVSVLATY